MDIILLSLIIVTPIVYFLFGYVPYKKLKPKYLGFILFACLFFVFEYVMQDMMKFLNVSLGKVDYSDFTLIEIVKFNRICVFVDAVTSIIPKIFLGIGFWFITQFVGSDIPIKAKSV